MSDGLRIGFERSVDEGESGPLSQEGLQAKAENTVSLQLSWLGGMRLFEIDERGELDPDLVIEVSEGKYLHLFVRGVETTGELPPRESSWLEERLARARREGLLACFVEVFFKREGKGHGVRWRGLETVRRGIAAVSEGVAPAAWYSSTESEVHDDEDSPEYQAERHLQMALMIVAGKSVDGIPDGLYCYGFEVPEERRGELEECAKVHGERSDECRELWWKLKQTRRCPYQKWTDYGMVTCHYLEESAVGISEEDYDKALAHFGSREALDEACTGNFLLGDAVRCCTRVVERVKASLGNEKA